MTVAWRRPTALPIVPFQGVDLGYATMRVTSPFGWRDNPIGAGTVFHGGLDIGNARLGDDVVAAAAGRVEAVGILRLPWSQPTTAYATGNYGGLMVVLDHGTHISLYAHLRAEIVTAGQQVAAGQKIGEIGETGSAIGQGHLHFGVSNRSAAQIKAAGVLLPNSWCVDPWPLISGALLPDTALPSGDPMFTMKAEAWKAGKKQPDGSYTPADIFESPAAAARLFPIPGGTALTTVGETLDGLWRLVAVSRSPGDRTLAYVKRAQLTPMVMGGDAAFADAVWSLLLARAAPVAAVDCAPLETRFQGSKDKVTAGVADVVQRLTNLALDVAND